MGWHKAKKRSGEEEEDPNQNNPFIQCAELVLPWLTPQELANTSLACKPFYQLSQSITLRRSLDASRSLDPLPIPFHNYLHRHPPYSFFLYTPSQLLSSFPPRQPWGSPSPSARFSPVRGVGHCDCDCEGCGEVEDGGNGYVLGAEEEELGIMRECGESCRCGLGCANRVTQRGITVKLRIVRDERKGWGLFAHQLIRRGQFVCEYAGELLTTKEARSRQLVYDELSSAGNFSSALLVVREHLPSGKACLRINIDATRIGNVARFINHSCDGGNLSTILVRSAGALLPRLCFFASRDIKDGEELTFSYGETRVRPNGLRCHCGSSCCQGSLPSEQT